MPRVNRDLQRRMAARRDRERRRPATERRYRFGEPEQAAAPDDTLVEDEPQATEAVEAPPRRARATATQPAAASTRAGARAPLPFSAFAADYAYVLSDLRRVALVIGSLLVILLLLYFVLPR